MTCACATGRSRCDASADIDGGDFITEIAEIAEGRGEKRFPTGDRGLAQERKRHAYFSGYGGHQ
jgi:hypothetical protein